MIRFDEKEYEFAAPGGSLTVFIRAEKNERRVLDWMIEGRLSAVGAPVSRGDFAGQRTFDFFLSASGGTAVHLAELPGQIDARTEQWQLFKAVILMPRRDQRCPKPGINGKHRMPLNRTE
jgi:hypothetical protein